MQRITKIFDFQIKVILLILGILVIFLINLSYCHTGHFRHSGQYRHSVQYRHPGLDPGSPKLYKY